MCRIIYKKNNDVKLDKKMLAQSHLYNPDGTGIIYYDSNLGHNVIKKFDYKTNFEEIYKYISKIEHKDGVKNMIIHFRFGTSGDKSLNNVHPITINKSKDQYLIHNGVIREFEFGGNKSDTAHLAQWMYENNFSTETNKNSANYQLLNNLLSGNKILLIEKDNVKIFNAQLGEEMDGVWYSWKQTPIGYNDKSFLYGWTDEEEYDNTLLNDDVQFWEGSQLEDEEEEYVGKEWKNKNTKGY